jgi:hypothetical protein
MKQLVFGIVLFLSAVVSGADPMTWDASNNFGRWGKPVRMRLERKNGILVMKSEKNDPCFQLDKLAMKPSDYGLFVLEYRVPGKIPSGKRGKIYFLRNEDKTLSGAYINLGSYICDGKWHRKEIPLTAANITPFKSWEKASGIRKLRFDPFENEGTLEIRSMAFLHDVRKSVRKSDPRLKPEELLEKSEDGMTFAGISGNYKVSADKPADGKYCLEQGGSSNEESVARSRTVFPVKPDTRYVIRFHSRNTVPVGHVLFRFIQSRKADELAPTSYLDSGWTQISCNMDQWTQSEKEFRTFKNTHGIAVAFHVKNNGVGKAWWDKFELEEIRETQPRLTIQPNSLFDTFTDLKTQEAYQYAAAGKKRKQTAWREITEKDNPLVIECNSLIPASAKVTVTLDRAGKILFKNTLNAAEKVSFPLSVLSLPEGKYRLTAAAEKDGKTLCRAETYIYRHPSVKLEKPEPVEQVSIRPERRELLVNGKPFLKISLSGFPSVFISPDLTAFPRAAELITLARRHFGINILSVITYGKAPDYKKLPREEYLKQAVKFYTESYRKQLDFCQRNQVYARVSLHMGSGIARKGIPDPELAAKVFANIRRHPALLEYWYDEPEPRKCPPEAIGKLYRAVKQADPNHPVNINLCVRSTFGEYLKYSDIASFDFYPFPHSDLTYWQTYNHEMMKCKPGAPLEAYLQNFQFGTTEFPTHDNMYGGFITSFINGSRSVKFFTYYSNSLQSLTTHPHAQATVRLIANHAIQLTPFLFDAKETKTALKAGRNILYRYYSNGKAGCLLAVNLSSKNTERFTLDLPGKGEITDFFDSAWKYPRGGTISLAPCGSIVLKVK